jgi:protein-S-isoprenylcysteine O-methyltransferase Ste14
MRRLSKFTFRFRGLLPLAVIPFLLFLEIKYVGSEFSDEFLDLGGLAIALCGEAVRMLAIGYSVSGTSSRGKLATASMLSTTGPYSVTRNPIYLGNILIVLGLAIIWGNPLFVLIAFILATAFFCIVIAHEEEILEGKFGPEFTAYKKRTSRLFPRFKNHIPGKTKFDWRRIVRREYNTVLLVFVLCYTIESYEEIVLEKKLDADFWFSSGFIFCLFLVWLLIRAWKKGLFEESPFEGLE